VKINDNIVKLSIDEVEISSQDIEGWLVSNQGGLTVALDVSISEELREEGNARELINRVQNLRKDSGLEVTDKIKLSIEKNSILEQAVQSNEQYIKNETLTAELQFVNSIENGIEIEFDEVKTKILIEKT
jgi:isoleucyl-tRNA synthetase